MLGCDEIKKCFKSIRNTKKLIKTIQKKFEDILLLTVNEEFFFDKKSLSCFEIRVLQYDFEKVFFYAFYILHALKIITIKKDDGIDIKRTSKSKIRQLTESLIKDVKFSEWREL